MTGKEEVIPILIGSRDFCLRFSVVINKLPAVGKCYSTLPSNAWSELLSAHPNLLIAEIGIHHDEAQQKELRALLNTAKERFGDKLYIVLALTAPSNLIFGGELLFEEDGLNPSGLIDSFIVTPPSMIPTSMGLPDQLKNVVEHAEIELSRRTSGLDALPTLNSDGWAQSLADPESRELWNLWLPRYASYVNENPLVIGETGTGKTNLALALHILSKRSGNFVSITPRDFSSSELVQAELFGAVEGAYTGAVNKWGLVKNAEKGTLFIDEMQSIDKGLQGKLITFIENKNYRRVGSSESTTADVRFVFATNTPLFELMETDILRHDFAYRLERVCLELKPLRERRLDIAAALSYALAKIHRQRSTSHKIYGFTQDAYRMLFCHNWPGNLRQLENMAAMLCELADFRERNIINGEIVSKIFESRLSGKVVTAQEVISRAALDLSEKALAKKITTIQEGVSNFTNLVRMYALEASAGETEAASNLISDNKNLLTFIAHGCTSKEEEGL